MALLRRQLLDQEDFRVSLSSLVRVDPVKLYVPNLQLEPRLEGSNYLVSELGVIILAL